MQPPRWISWQALSQYISVEAEQLVGPERRERECKDEGMKAEA